MITLVVFIVEASVVLYGLKEPGSVMMSIYETSIQSYLF